jgi:imidazolonepropionase-like amidohydrolase
MTRTVFKGARVFDGTGAEPADGDVVVENSRIVAIGSGLDGDKAVELSGRTILPGFFDCHVHVTVSDVDLWKEVQRPFSRQFYEAGRNLLATLRTGITSIRDAGGADLGIKEAVDEGLIAGPRM